MLINNIIKPILIPQVSQSFSISPSQIKGFSFFKSQAPSK